MPAARAGYAALRGLIPEAVDGLGALGRASHHPDLDAGLLELVDIRASQMNGCAYCLQLHANRAQRHGVAAGKLTQVAVWRESGLFSDRERTALELAEALTRLDPAHGLAEPLYAAARQEFGEAALAALVAKILVINAWNRLMVAYRIAPPEAEA
ncbi:MAG: carboxymuconolactone decarboxylase family protein [Acetobacteraceae bacterium]|nr:carboxymuconolactone decarboxylase family protein [Acetobacteraceae bacterium]